jgi:hypothetical protein
LSEDKKRTFFYNFAKDSYDNAKETLENIDSKINNLFTLDAGLITVVTGLTYFVIQNLLLTKRYQPILLTPVAISLTLFVLSVMAGVMAYAPTERSVVDPQELILELKNAKYDTVLSRTAATISYATSKNSDLVNAKAAKVKWMSWLVFLGLLFAALGFILFFYQMSSTALV